MSMMCGYDLNAFETVQCYCTFSGRKYDATTELQDVRNKEKYTFIEVANLLLSNQLPTLHSRGIRACGTKCQCEVKGKTIRVMLDVFLQITG